MNSILSYDDDTITNANHKVPDAVEKQVWGTCEFLGTGTDAEISYDETDGTYLVTFTRSADYDNEQLSYYLGKDGEFLNGPF